MAIGSSRSRSLGRFFLEPRPGPEGIEEFVHGLGQRTDLMGSGGEGRV
jgi:hypothetical protein